VRTEARRADMMELERRVVGSEGRGVDGSRSVACGEVRARRPQRAISGSPDRDFEGTRGQ
jgi:hypothetical protein